MTEGKTGKPRDEAELFEQIRAIDAPAPARLHARLQAMVEGAAPARARERGRSPTHALAGRRRLGWAAIAATCAAAAIVLALAGSGSPGPTLSEATAVTLRAPSMPAPAENPASRTRLAAAVDGVAFPYWEHRFGWRASGQRFDSIDGRTIRTVFYTNAAGLRIGYGIVAGRPAPDVASGAVSWRHHTRYQLTREHGAEVITWQRDGHLCIVSGRGVDASTLLALASWDEHGTVS